MAQLCDEQMFHACALITPYSLHACEIKVGTRRAQTRSQGCHSLCLVRYFPNPSPYVSEGLVHLACLVKIMKFWRTTHNPLVALGQTMYHPCFRPRLLFLRGTPTSGSCPRGVKEEAIRFRFITLLSLPCLLSELGANLLNCAPSLSSPGCQSIKAVATPRDAGSAR